ncbi:MAG: bifunctional folylpolyglutamate synthase/dihydrofolate synthase [Synechococcales cyanobacterium T60_A2020_003]|nr:bifunctional folylpolyglutamate synthase/dihydrofolate synthase [Synechococcales cyanobacterium T60_A2020_003]
MADVDRTLASFSHFGVELGLERIQRLLANLGNPQDQVPVIHVAGSNGKGSVCAYLSSVLVEAGYRVGRYISPHLVSWCERIWINGVEITPEALRAVLDQVLAAIQPDAPSPTQFEVITAAAWLYFAQQQVDIAVIEVGLGGRLDATNVCDRPLVSVITSISREHWQRLGPTLGDIAYEKAGILKPACPAVIGVLPSDATQVVERRSREVDCPAVWVRPSLDLGSGLAQYQGIQSTPVVEGQDKSIVDPDVGFTYPLPLLGAHQRMNSALAIAALQILQTQGWTITDEQMQSGLAKTQWTARLQWYTWQNCTFLIDAAHNSAGALMLRDYLDQSDRVQTPITWVIGMISNKDHAEVFSALLRPGDTLHLVPVPDHITEAPTNLAAIAQTVCPDLADCLCHNDAIAGLQAALFSTEKPPGTVVLCGSIYMIGYVLKEAQGLTPEGRSQTPI